MNARVCLALLLSALPACSAFDRLYPPSQYDAQGAAAPTVAAPAAQDVGATIQQTAKTTLLLENENLRDQLAGALEDRRKLDAQLQRAREEAERCQGVAKEREDAIHTLSEQMQALQGKLAEALAERDRFAADRRTLAEMFALEKKQRLAFEKDLLEREIAERTHGAESTPAAGRRP